MMDHDKAGRGEVQGDAKLTQQSKQEGKGGRWIAILDGPTYLGKTPVGSQKKS
jgi:hypothetical protein